MTKLQTLFVLTSFLSAVARAQDPAASPPEKSYVPLFSAVSAPSRTEWMTGISYLRWNEPLRLQKSTLLDTDTANFTGMNLNLERRVVYANWGWSTEVNFGAGRANGGGNSSSITYTANNQKWTSFGAGAKAFYRLTPQVSLGAAMPLVLRNITWSSPDGIVEATSGQNINLGLLFDLVLRVDRNIDFYQEIGALNSQGSTMWRLGLNFRLK